MPISEEPGALPKCIAIPRSVLSDPDHFGGTPQGDCQRGAPILRDGRIVALEPADGHASIVLPRLTEPHCHLDKCHTLPRMGPVAGTLSQAIEAQLTDKAHWTEDDIRTRASRGLEEARAAGVGLIRSHVDWGDGAEPPLSWHVLGALAADTSDITMTLSSLTNIAHMADPAEADTVARLVARTGGALGAFVLNQPERAEGIAQIFRVAERHGLALDFHVDEALGDVNGLEMVADVALETGFAGPVLCGHACSLMDRDANAIGRIADKLARAGIAVCALPTTNLYLQDRRDGTPDRRGLTRLKELRAAGVTVLAGSDNVGDAFCPMGQFDPMAALHLSALAAHLDPPMGPWLPMISTDAARALGAAPGYVDELPISRLLVSEATDTSCLVSGRMPMRHLGAAPSMQ